MLSRSRHLAVALFVLFLSSLYSQTAVTPKDSEPGWFATTQVQVRDSNGRPVPGLEPANFRINENGRPAQVISVRMLDQLTSSDSTSRTAAPIQQPPSPQTQNESARPTTWILVILAPMSVTGRNASITGLQKFLDLPHPADWSFALFDDSGDFLPFSKDVEALRSRLTTLEHHFSQPQLIGGPWMPMASRAIAEMGSRPGRRAIVFGSDFDSDSSTASAARLRVGPSSFVDAAVRVQAPMYTLQASGPGTAVPYGRAEHSASQQAQKWTSLAGQLAADRMNSDMVALGAAFSDFVWSAYQTGGRPARDIQDAFEKIADDAAGLYRITFHPNLLEADGGWHPISIDVQSPRAHARYTSYYVAAMAENRQQIPGAILAALEEPAKFSELKVAINAWVFPNTDGLSTSIMAADIAWPPTDQRIAPHSKLQIYAQLIDQNLGVPVGSWLTERESDSADDDMIPTIHWQREAPLYPGNYTLRVFAFDPTSKRVAKREYSFIADPVAGTGAIRFSHTLVADRCLEDEEREGRTNLLDPLMLDGCLLAPSASGIFSRDDQLSVLVRFCPASGTPDSAVLTLWKAYVTVGDSPLIPLTITAGSARGFIASGRLDLENLNLRPGKYQVSVGVDVGAKEPLFARPLELTIIPGVPNP